MCLHEGAVLLILLKDPLSGRLMFSFPGGRIETGERAAEAAVRETAEETGYTITTDPGPPFVLDYDYFWAGQWISCQTHFFLAHKAGSQLFQPEGIICGHCWVTQKECHTYLEDVFLRVLTHFFDDLS